MKIFDLRVIYITFLDLTCDIEIPWLGTKCLFDFMTFSYSVLYLDENKKLILAILDNQNLVELAECVQ